MLSVLIKHIFYTVTKQIWYTAYQVVNWLLCLQISCFIVFGRDVFFRFSLSCSVELFFVLAYAGLYLVVYIFYLSF